MNKLSKINVLTAGIFLALTCNVCFAKLADPAPASKDKASPGSPVSSNTEKLGKYFGHEFSITIQYDMPPANARKLNQKTIQTARTTCKKFARLLDIRDPKSKLSKFINGKIGAESSLGVMVFLKLANKMQVQSKGKFNLNAGLIERAWQKSADKGKRPSRKKLGKLIAKLKKPAYNLDPLNLKVTKIGKMHIADNSFARAYAIQQVSLAVQRANPKASAITISAGDISVSRKSRFAKSAAKSPPIAITTGAHPADQTPAISRATLQNQSLAICRPMQKMLTIAGKKYSTLIDPTTGKPASKFSLVAVVGKTPVKAFVQARLLALMSPKQAIAHATSQGQQALIIDAKGKVYTTENRQAFSEIIKTKAQAKSETGTSNLWSAGGNVKINLEIVKPKGIKHYRNPTVAIWVATKGGAPIKPLAIWGRSRKQQAKLTRWINFAQIFKKHTGKVTRNTRAPGKYELTWDGFTSKGRRVPPGEYTICIEIYRAPGKPGLEDSYQLIEIPIKCTGRKFTAKIEPDTNIGPGKVTFTP